MESTQADRAQGWSWLNLMVPEQELFILWLLKTEGEIGRYRLAKMLGVSQGIARGMLTQMKRRRLIIVRPRAGARPSQKGLGELSTLMSRHSLKLVERFDQELLGLGPASVVFQVSGQSHRLRHGIEQRDAAIKAGATGAVTFFFDGKILRFPGVVEPVSRRSSATFEQLKARLRMRKGDVVLIAFADTWWEAARGGFWAVRTLA